MDRGPDDPAGRDHTADQFEAIVAGWRREGVVPAWPGEERPPAEPPRTPPAPAPPVPPAPKPSAPALRPAPAPDGEAGGDVEADDDGSDHFVPPEPPPLPRPGPPAVVGFTLLLLGLTLVTVPRVVGVPGVYGLPLGLLVLAAGLGWLVLRLWPGPPDELDPGDDGAQI